MDLRRAVPAGARAQMMRLRDGGHERVQSVAPARGTRISACRRRLAIA
jgi:hypothetical protein